VGCRQVCSCISHGIPMLCGCWRHLPPLSRTTPAGSCPCALAPAGGSPRLRFSAGPVPLRPLPAALLQPAGWRGGLGPAHGAGCMGPALPTRCGYSAALPA
jgi:hypothetical protein